MLPTRQPPLPARQHTDHHEQGDPRLAEELAGDELLATAILDRLLHNSHVLDIKGRSDRLRDLEQAVSSPGSGGAAQAWASPKEGGWLTRSRSQNTTSLDEGCQKLGLALAREAGSRWTSATKGHWADTDGCPPNV